jgi:S1-C subfamily serine protease
MIQKILIGIAAISHTSFQALNQRIYVVAQEQESLSKQTDIVIARTQQERANLEQFDFGTSEGINNRNITTLREVHTSDVLAVGFGGGFGNNITKGIEPDLGDLKPTTEGLKILAHLIKIAAGKVI